MGGEGQAGQAFPGEAFVPPACSPGAPQTRGQTGTIEPSLHPQEAYSVARQFNLIPPICEQAEYHMFQREKVEVQLPELFHKIGGRRPVPPPPRAAGRPRLCPGFDLAWLSSRRSGRHDLVPAGLRHRFRKVRQWHPALLQSVLEGKGVAGPGEGTGISQSRGLGAGDLGAGRGFPGPVCGVVPG